MGPALTGVGVLVGALGSEAEHCLQRPLPSSPSSLFHCIFLLTSPHQCIPPPLARPLQWMNTQYDEYILALQRAAYEKALQLVEERRPVIEQLGRELCENR